MLDALNKTISILRIGHITRVSAILVLPSLCICNHSWSDLHIVLISMMHASTNVQDCMQSGIL